MRSNQLDALLCQPAIKWVRIICPVTNQSLWHIAHKAGADGGRNENDFMMPRRFGIHSQRQTSAVGDSHDFRAFAPLGLAHLIPPFFAATKVPSMKHSDRSNPPRSLRSWATALIT